MTISCIALYAAEAKGNKVTRTRQSPNEERREEERRERERERESFVHFQKLAGDDDGEAMRARVLSKTLHSAESTDTFLLSSSSPSSHPAAAGVF